MLYRVRQFFCAIMANGPDEAEQKIIDKELGPEAQELFFAMNKADQRHTLNVMRAAEALWQENRDDKGENYRLLVRCCLLHDVGRGRQMGPFRKTWAVLLNKFCPVWSKEHGERESKCYVRGLLYRYYHHAELSARLLTSIGMTKEAAIVALHHADNTGNLGADEIQILAVLKKADSLS